MSGEFRSYPRFREVDALTTFEELRGLTPDLASTWAGTNFDGLAFYPIAPARVDVKDLERVRNGVLAIAQACGFPEARRVHRDTGRGFDQTLAAEMPRLAPMLPGEAADAEVWNFITLRLLPDVAVWRNPLDDEYSLEPRADRFLGTRRGMFRQAWWRGYLLGPAACLDLTEDEMVQLVDRRGVVGHRPLASAIVDTHLRLALDPQYRRRSTIREVLKLARRELGRSAFETLGEDRIRSTVDALFARALGQAVVANVDASHEPADAPEPVESVRRFRDRAAPYLHLLSGSLHPLSRDESLEYAEHVRAHALRFGGDPVADRIASDLASLMGTWDDYSTEQTSLIRAACDYFILELDDVADHGPDGLLDDDDVVDALFFALGRERGAGAAGV